MKSITLSIAMIAVAISFSSTAQAQMVRTITGNDKVSCTQGQTVIDGAWGIVTDSAGTLVITDKNNTIVRMVADGGKTVVAEQGVNTTAANYPLSLVVDKCGNLHITDNTIYSSLGAAQPAVLPNENNSWGDPDVPGASAALQTIVSNAKR